MIEVFGRATSSNVQAVMWAIGELGLEYKRHDIGHVFGGNDTADYLAMNPHGKVPMIRDGDGPPIWESGAILRYLAGRYGADPFWPADPVARARVDMWAEWAKVSVCVGFTVPIFWRVVRTAPSQRDPEAIAAAVGQIDGLLARAEDQLAGSAYLAGDEFTLADILLGHILYRYFDIEVARPDLPALRGYYDRLCARPAYREHVMVSYESLRVTEG